MNGHFFQPSAEHEKKKNDLDPHLALLVLQPALVCLYPALCTVTSVTNTPLYQLSYQICRYLHTRYADISCIPDYCKIQCLRATSICYFTFSGHWKKLIEHRWLVPLNEGLGLLNLAHKNTGCPAKFEYWMHSG